MYFLMPLYLWIFANAVSQMINIFQKVTHLLHFEYLMFTQSTFF